jgi:general secretion pathway protein K
LLTRPQGISQFVALMRVLGISEAEARKAAVSLADWIDSDAQPQPEGAEDQAYAGAETPYRTGNTLLADSSELRAIAGVTPELYEKVRPWVCALPVTDLSPINVNTLTLEQAPLLSMLMLDRLSPDRARALLLARPPGGYESAYAFWRSSALEGQAPGGDVEAQTGVRTRWFTLQLRVLLGDNEVNETALIDAGLPPAKLVRRSWGEGD